MSHRVVEIANPSHVKTQGDHVVIERDGTEVGRVPIADLAVLIFDSYGISTTHELLADLAEANVAVIICNEKHMPVAMHLGFEGHHLHAAVLRQQTEASEPTKKRIWQLIVQAKIRAQADAVLRCKKGQYKRNAERVRVYAKHVRSGDPDNVEARAAAYYWEALFGSDFVRDRDLPGVNACLNYGYAVLRASITRGLVGTGLHPALGIHHRNQFNAYALADDAMEPLRPLVDVHVFEMTKEEDLKETELTPHLKRRLLEFTVFPIKIAGKSYPMQVGIPLYAATLKQAICRERRSPSIPAIFGGAATG